MTASRTRRESDGITSLILPTFNPGSVLEKTCRRLAAFLREAPRIWEILFVCDGCTDGSERRLADWSRPFGGQVRILSHTPNRGKGYTVRTGLTAARGEWRLFTDVDLAYGLEDVVKVAETLRAGAEVAIASRTQGESRLVVPPSLLGYVYRRQLQSCLFSTLVRWLLPLQVRDTQAGLKGLSAGTARQLLPLLTCDGFGFDCELLTACACFGLPVVEVPVSVHYEDRASTTSFGSAGRLLRELLQIRRNWSVPLGGEPASPSPVPLREAA